MVMFNTYVKLPEGNSEWHQNGMTPEMGLLRHPN